VVFSGGLSLGPWSSCLGWKLRPGGGPPLASSFFSRRPRTLTPLLRDCLLIFPFLPTRLGPTLFPLSDAAPRICWIPPFFPSGIVFLPRTPPQGHAHFLSFSSNPPILVGAVDTRRGKKSFSVGSGPFGGEDRVHRSGLVIVFWPQLMHRACVRLFCLWRSFFQPPTPTSPFCPQPPFEPWGLERAQPRRSFQESTPPALLENVFFSA